MTDIRILSCPQCGFPKIRDCGNGLYQCDDCGTHFDKNENIVQTNEEWFCGLDTEDKAREISDMTAQGYWEEELVYKWLKEKHHAN